MNQRPSAGRSERTLRGAALGVAAIGGVLALVTALVGFWLARVYRPGPYFAHAPGLSAGAATSQRWSDWHRVTSGVLVVLAALVVVLAALQVFRDRAGTAHRGRITLGAAVLALVAAVVTIATRSVVEFDQLGLWAVTVGGTFDGYWFAAFSDEVRFVIVDSQELSPTEYGVILVVHLAAPVLAAVGLAAVALEERRSWRARVVTGGAEVSSVDHLESGAPSSAAAGPADPPRRSLGPDR